MIGSAQPCPSLMTRLVAGTIVVLAVIQPRYQLGFDSPLLALTGLVIVLCLNDANLPTLGLTSRPFQGWWYWCRIAICFAVVIGIAVAICGAVFWAQGWKMPTAPRTPPTIQAFVWMCVNAPFSEEVIFRALLTVAVLPSLGELGTIILGGIVFALAHVVGGNAGPDNQIAGFMLGWAFLKSRTILVPIAMHASGNLIALCCHVAAWYID